MVKQTLQTTCVCKHVLNLFILIKKEILLKQILKSEGGGIAIVNN